MKVAIGFLAYRVTKTLIENLKLISMHDDIYSVVVWDKGSINDRDDILGLSDYFFETDEAVSWGGLSQLKAQIKLLDIVSRLDFDYLTCLSETDAIIGSLEEYKENLISDGLNIKIGFKKCDGVPVRLNGKDLKYVPEKYKKKKLKLYEKFFSLVYNCYYSRKYSNSGPFYKGPNWISVNKEFIHSFLKYWSEINDAELFFLQKILSVDEIIFQTYVIKYYTGNFKISEIENDNLQSGRYIDWSVTSDPPKSLDLYDLKVAKSMGFTFARKYEGE